MHPALYLAQCRTHSLVLTELNSKLEQNDLSGCQPCVMCWASCCWGHTRGHLGATPQTKDARVSIVNSFPIISGCLWADARSWDSHTSMSDSSFQTRTTATGTRQSPCSEHTPPVAAMPQSIWSPGLCCVSPVCRLCSWRSREGQKGLQSPRARYDPSLGRQLLGWGLIAHRVEGILCYSQSKALWPNTACAQIVTPADSRKGHSWQTGLFADMDVDRWHCKTTAVSVPAQ